MDYKHTMTIIRVNIAILNMSVNVSRYQDIKSNGIFVGTCATIVQEKNPINSCYYRCTELVQP